VRGGEGRGVGWRVRGGGGYGKGLGNEREEKLGVRAEESESGSVE
jgi:hypothetical protein